ncbi:MAG: hypothetical protein ACTSVV_02190 [Promethearchaeota archaeon]
MSKIYEHRIDSIKENREYQGKKYYFGGKKSKAAKRHKKVRRK